MTTEFFAGDSIKLEYSSDYDNTWTANLIFSGASSFTLTGTIADGCITFSEVSATTASYTVGDYTAWLTVTKGTDRYILQELEFTIKTNPASHSGTVDLRTANEIALDKIEAVLEGRATDGVDSYSINGRSLNRMPMNDLMALYKHYLRKVKIEKGTYGKPGLAKMTFH